MRRRSLRERLRKLRWGLGLVALVMSLLAPLGAAPQTAQPPPTAKTAPPGARGTVPAGEVEDLFQRATDLIYKDRPADAIPLLRRALQIAPNEEPLHRYLGWTLMVGSQLPAAQKEFEEALKIEPGNVYSQYFLARTLDMQGQRDRALAHYEVVLASGNVINDTYQQLGQAYARRREYNKAEAMLNQALRLTPWDGSLHTQLGAIYRRMGREEEARQEFAEGERLKNRDEASIQKMLQLSEAIRLKDAGRALTLRGELMSESGTDPDILTWLGALLGGGGLYRESLEPLQVAMKLRPASYETSYNLGLTLARLGRSQEAEAPLRKAVELRPHSFEANLMLAIAYVNEGENSEAIKRLRAAHQIQPDNLRVTLLLGQQYMQGWYLQQAIETFHDALKVKPNDLQTRYLLIEAYQVEQADDKALEVARDTAKLYPQEARARFEIGQQLANLGHYQEARPHFEQALRLDPDFLPARISLADVQYRNGEAAAALENFQKVRGQDPESLEGGRGVARCLFRLRRYPEALADVQASIARHPDDGDLYLLLAQVESRLGHTQEAAQANANFEKLHAAERAKQVSQRPRTYVPGGTATTP